MDCSQVGKARDFAKIFYNKIMRNTTQLGLLTELHCQLDFTKYGFLLSQPICADSRYDYIANIKGKFYKIQCKSSSPIDNNSAFTFAVSSINNYNGVRKDYHGEIDYFYTYFKKQGYLIPIDKVGKGTKTLRLENRTNIHNPSITWAKDYKIEVILGELANCELINAEDVKNNKIVESNYHCIDCGVPITNRAIRCRTCNSKYCKEIGVYKTFDPTLYPSREELKDMIKNKSFVQIGAMYGISDNAVRKWCKKFKLPYTKKEINNFSEEEWKLL